MIGAFKIKNGLCVRSIDLSVGNERNVKKRMIRSKCHLGWWAKRAQETMC